jgi:hypothetical protein
LLAEEIALRRQFEAVAAQRPDVGAE